MALFSSVFRRLFERFAHFALRRETPQRAQQCAAQELAAEKLPEQCEAFDSTANDRKRRKRRRKVHKDEAEITLSLKKIKKRGRVHQKNREMHGLEKLMEGGSELREAGEKKRKKRKRKERKLTEPMPLLVKVKPVHTTVRSSFLKPIEGELPMLPSVSGHLALPASHFKPLPPVTKPVHPQKPDPAPEDVSCSPLQRDRKKLLAVPPCPDEVVSIRHSSSQVRHPKRLPPRPTPPPDEVFSIRHSSSQVRHPKRLPPRPTPPPDEVFSIRHSSSQVRHPKRLPPRPTPPPDEVFSIRHSSSQVRHPKRLPPRPTPDEVLSLKRPLSRNPELFRSSLFEPLILIDIENEENEYVEYTGKTIRASDLLKSERPQTPEAEIQPRKLFAWREKDSKVQDEARASEVVEAQAFEEEEEEGDASEMGESKAIQGHSDDASQIDELPMKLFCVASPDSPKNETQHDVKVQTKSKRKVLLALFTWAEEKAKKKQEKKIIKEKERREKELLRERYMNDPKLKHLWINKHNRNYKSS